MSDSRENLEALAAKRISRLLHLSSQSSVADIENAAKDLMLSNANKGNSIRLRSLYYRHAHLFNNQEQCNRHLRGILREAGCTQRNAFGIVPKPKGLVAGPICRKGSNPTSDTIEISPDFADNIDWARTNAKLRCVLVVEKDTMFFSMLPCLVDLDSVLLMTGRGFPDI